MQIRSCFERSALVIALSFTLAPRLFAQDPFELEVYTPAIAAPGEWELGFNANYVADGRTTFDGPLAPTDRQGRLSVELTHGVTSLWEVSAYGLAASRPGAGAEWAGWRVRTRVRAPDHWRLPVQLGLNLEFSQIKTRYSEHGTAIEFAPTVGWRSGRLGLAANVPFERSVGSAGEQEWEVEPRARLDLVLGRRVTFTTEYFTGLGSLEQIDPIEAQRHLLFPGVALHLGDDIEWTAAIGFGLTDASDRRILKTAIEFPLHE